MGPQPAASIPSASSRTGSARCSVLTVLAGRPYLAGVKTCALCGCEFAILVPETAEATESDRLCPDCARLPEPPEGTED